MTHRWTAQELLDLVLDKGSFESWDEPIAISDAPDDYGGGRRDRRRDRLCRG